MRPVLSALAALFALSISGCGNDRQHNQPTDVPINQKEQQQMKLTAPIAEKIPHSLEKHGHVRQDPYHWLRDDSRTDPRVLAHLQAENAYLEQELAHIKDSRQRIFEELISRIQPEDASVPVLDNGYWYHYQYNKGSEYAVHYRRLDKSDAEPQVLIDENQLAEGQEYFDLGDYDISRDNSMLAYSTDSVGRRIFTIAIRDLTTGELLPEQIEGTSGSVVWANDNQHLFYLKKDPQTLLAYQVYRHKLGEPVAKDVLVYEETDTSFYTEIGRTRDHSLITVFHQSTETVAASYLDANKPTGAFQPLISRQDKVQYDFDRLGEMVYLRTNQNAKNFKLVKASLAEINDSSKWQTVVTHREDVTLEEFDVFKDYIVVSERQQGQVRLRVIEQATGKDHTIEFQDPIYMAAVGDNPAIDTQQLRVVYSSMTTPKTVYEIDLKTFARKQLKQTKVLGGFDPNNYQSERVSIKARDGVEVPVSLVYRKDTFKQDGTNPLYQYGYGAYGITIDPYFSDARLSLLDRGFVMAYAHVRGGQLLGKDWYDGGRLKNKTNSFNDFIDVTKGLLAQKYADPDKVFAVGGSAGGLLMGAVINQAPELYLGVAAHVPFVDVVSTMLDDSLPLTTNEYDEWGNPNVKEDYFTMLAYSPYDNVKAQDYPNMLVTTGLHDSQVQYFEPAKWVAKLRELKTDDNKILFYTDLEAGHGGASGRFKQYQDTALEYGFILDLAGIKH